MNTPRYCVEVAGERSQRTIVVHLSPPSSGPGSGQGATGVRSQSQEAETRSRSQRRSRSQVRSQSPISGLSSALLAASVSLYTSPDILVCRLEIPV